MGLGGGRKRRREEREKKKKEREGGERRRKRGRKGGFEQVGEEAHERENGSRTEKMAAVPSQIHLNRQEISKTNNN